MAHKWSRELVLREILAREGTARPLWGGGRDGINSALYQAGARFFGSWDNALRAAGVAARHPPSQERWPPGRILAIIRALARRGRPLRIGELQQRYAGCLIPAARRCFGSWRKAVIAAGVEPQRLQRAPAWTKERVLEAILTRALNDAPLRSRTVEPRTLASAGVKFYGTWPAALKAAGLNPDEIRKAPLQRLPSGATAGTSTRSDVTSKSAHRWKWSPQMVVNAIRQTAASGKGIRASVVYRENRALSSAAARRFGNWSKALAAAGIDSNGPTLAGSAPLPPLSSGRAGPVDVGTQGAKKMLK